MRFDFFRRPGVDGNGAQADTTPAITPAVGADGHVAYAMLLDGKRRVVGYRMAWRAAGQGTDAGAAAGVKALMDTLGLHLNPGGHGWLLGGRRRSSTSRSMRCSRASCSRCRRATSCCA